MATQMLTASCSESAFKMPENRDKNMYLTNNSCHILIKSVKRCFVRLDRSPWLHQTAALALLLLISDLSDGCSDHLSLLILGGCTKLHRNREISQDVEEVSTHFTFHVLIPFWWAHQYPGPTVVFLLGCPTSRQILTWKWQRSCQNGVIHQGMNLSLKRKSKDGAFPLNIYIWLVEGHFAHNQPQSHKTFF